MIGGAILIGSAVASGKEHISWNDAVRRECDRYDLDYSRTLQSLSGNEFDQQTKKRRWWDYLILVVAVSFFIWFARTAVVPPIAINYFWLAVLSGLLLVVLAIGVFRLWRSTRFS